ncbi:MAG: DUF2892 domain-containing protein [Gemmatimonadetes bacterium]|nr:DUF2892 domain-containing protein [Gemmatimonadota bacterium]
MAVKCNVGTADRIVRVVIGLSLILFGVFGLFPGVWRIVVPAVGLVAIVTAAIGYCPAYRLFGLSSAQR